MAFALMTLFISLGLFLGMLALQELGRRLGRRRLASDPEGTRRSHGAVEGAVFGLLGLLMAFTFSGAATRFDGRRQLVAQEANAIGTAYLRLDLLPTEAQPALRDAFRSYLDARLATYQDPPNSQASKVGLEHSIRWQNTIWSQSVAASRSGVAPSTPMLLLPALNEMIDITTTRAMAVNQHPPTIVYLMLGILTLAGALLVGHASAEDQVRSWAITWASRHSSPSPSS